MNEIALIVCIAAFVLDGITTRMGMKRGFIESGFLSTKLFGTHLSDKEILVWHGAKIGIALLLYFQLPSSYVPWVLFGLSIPTAYAAISNYRKIKQI